MFNKLKVYNQLLDLEALSEPDRKKSLMGIFDRDIATNPCFQFRKKDIKPTPKDGKIEMNTLYTHLTTVIVDKKTSARDFDIHRSKRLHWVKYHIEEQKKVNMLVFSVKEPDGIRTYIYDKDEKYVIVLEPRAKNNDYFLLTAFYVRGKDAERNKYEKKFCRKLDRVY